MPSLKNNLGRRLRSSQVSEQEPISGKFDSQRSGRPGHEPGLQGSFQDAHRPSAQTPQSKSKLRLDLVNSNAGRRPLGAPFSRLQNQFRHRRLLTPHHKHSSSSNKKIGFDLDKHRKGGRQAVSNVKEIDGEQPRNLAEVRKKLNLTGGYAEALGKLRTYGTNHSSQSQAKQRASGAKGDARLGLGAFLKAPRPKRGEEHPQNVKINTFLRAAKAGAERSSDSGKKLKSRKQAKKEQLRRQLFNQNVATSSRLGAQKMLSMRGIKSRFGKRGEKYTSSRHIDDPGAAFDNFQSHRAHAVPGRGLPGLMDSEKQFSSNKFDGRGKTDGLETREDMERFADYLAEKADARHEPRSSERLRQSRSGSVSAQISPNMRQKESFFARKK